jgi:hypothetical protein
MFYRWLRDLFRSVMIADNRIQTVVVGSNAVGTIEKWSMVVVGYCHAPK